jgi:hypothetical protein
LQEERAFIVARYVATKYFAAVHEAFHRMHHNEEVPNKTTIFRPVKNVGRQGVFATGNMLRLWQF